MPRPTRRAVRRPATAAFRLVAATILISATVSECLAIEMFTFFGDGSRIGLPNLEVPVEAYPGIPLRSDRIRARRAGRRPSAAAPVAGQPGMPSGITIRTMPPIRQPAEIRPAPRMQPASRRSTPAQATPVAPSPEDLMPGEVLPPLAE
jgi:hypothetical protein